MYKVIESEIMLLQWEQETKCKLFLWNNKEAVNHIRQMVHQLDFYYGVHRDIKSDLGGYTIFFFGEQKIVREEYMRMLQYHHLQEELYEFEDVFINNQGRMKVRLYLCSSDYSIVVVLMEE